MPEDAPLFKRKHKPQIDIVTVGSTSKTIATLLGAEINDWTKVITFMPITTGIFVNDGESTGASDSFPLLTNSLEMIGGRDILDALQFYAATNLTMAIMQEG